MLLEERHAQVLGGARAFEAALNHVVNLELLAAEPPADTPTPARSLDAPPAEREASQVPAGEPEAKTRRTIDIVGDPDKPRRETVSEHPSPTAGENGETEDPDRPIPAPEPSGSA
jgi:hypothetical protein